MFSIHNNWDMVFSKIASKIDGLYQSLFTFGQSTSITRNFVICLKIDSSNLFVY